jgi:hypothetical protein
MFKKILIAFIIFSLPTLAQAKYAFRYLKEQREKEQEKTDTYKIPEKEFVCDADCKKIRKMFFENDKTKIN